MDSIKYPPDRLYRRFTPGPILHYSFAFESVKPYMNVVPLYEYIDKADQNRLQNLLNYISNAWEKIKRELQSSKSFLKSHYHSITIPRCSHPITHQIWEDHITEFINNDICMALFVVKSIMTYVFPD